MNLLFGHEVTTPLSISDHAKVVQVDQATGLVEFPSPGDVKRHLLPVLIDPEEVKIKSSGAVESSKNNIKHSNEYWMPDKLCKICYKCELPFTMYRRRHHCRMCGQIFCNQCSSFYIEQGVDNQTVRCCRLCYDQLGATYDQDIKLQFPIDKRPISRTNRRNNGAVINENNNVDEYALQQQRSLSQQGLPTSPSQIIVESSAERERYIQDLDDRACSHLKSIVHLLISQSKKLNTICSPDLLKSWESIVVSLVKEVVGYVDPDVRNGDNLDIRPYVKLKVIPGGQLSDNAFINGIVFRKNVSHKKMATEKFNPRLLLLGGGIEFQREDQKLSSLDTLIEQEDKYTEILVEKIMSLKPDIILVGRSVARKAQEILCSHNVVVMQNVKTSLLERVSRMTGALMLPSTDHMIQRYGEDCLGSCGRFWLRKVFDDEKNAAPLQSPVRLRSGSRAKAPLKRITDKQKCTTYAYLEGCPPELGCTVILRGGAKDELLEIKRIIKFSVMLAYHLRLEVAFYADRCGRLPPQMNTIKSGYESEDDVLEELQQRKLQNSEEDGGKALNSGAGVDGATSFLDDPVQRSLLSTSFDVDIRKPFQDEVRYDSVLDKAKDFVDSVHKPSDLPFARSNHSPSPSPEDHQTLLVTSLLMTKTTGASSVSASSKPDRSNSLSADSGGGGQSLTASASAAAHQSTGTQRSKADVKGIRFYTNQDVALGQFLIESCFQMYDRIHNNTVMMMEHTLSFIHRPGRIDISVTKLPGNANPSSSGANVEGSTSRSHDKPHSSALHNQTNAALANLGVIDAFEEDDRKGRIAGHDPLHAPIFLYSFCKLCRRVVTPIVEISDETWKLSFGKFMEISFYNHSARCRTGQCSHFLRDDHILSFACEGFVAQFEFIPIHPLSLHPRNEMHLPISFHSAMIVNVINECIVQSSKVLEDFSAVIAGLEKILSHVLSSRPEVLKVIRNDISVVKQDLDFVMDQQADDVEVALQLIQQNKTPRFVESFDHSIGGDVKMEESSPEGRKIHKAALMTIYPMCIRRDMLQKATTWNAKINEIYRFIDSIESLNNSSGGAVEIAELPDDEDLLLIRSSILGKLDANSHDSKVDVPSPSSPTRSTSRNISDLPLETGVDTVSDEKCGESIPSLVSEKSVEKSDTPPNEVDVSTLLSQNDIIDAEEIDSPHLPTAIPSQSTKQHSSKEKSTRLAKAIQRFMKKDDHGSGQKAFAVGVDELCKGRLGLPPGRNGRVIAVHEEQLSTVIAYSLASEEYYENLQVLREEDSGVGLHGEGHGPGDRARSSEMKKKRFVPFGASRHLTKDLLTSRLSRTDRTSWEHHDLENMKQDGDHDNEKIHENEEEDYDDLQIADQSDNVYIEDDDVNIPSVAVSETIEPVHIRTSPKLEPIPEENHTFSNKNISSTFQRMVGNGEENSQKETEKRDGAYEEDENEDDHEGNKSYKFLDFNYEDALKVEGLAAPKPKLSSAADFNGQRLADLQTSKASEKNRSNDVEGDIPSPPSAPLRSPSTPLAAEAAMREKFLVSQRKTHIKHRFNDIDPKTKNVSCKFICHIFYATQFQALRAEYLKDDDDDEGFIRSLSMADQWNAQGGKSGASFSKSSDCRFVVKHITRTELQMFLDFAPAYFEYLAKSFYHALPTFLVKILGVYQLGYHNRMTGKRVMEQVVIMENLFYDRNITRIFDLKGSSRQRYVEILGENGEKIDDFDSYLLKKRNLRRHKDSKRPIKFSSSKVCLDDNLMELTRGKPIPLKHRAKVIFNKAVMNDTLFLSIINIVDYSILVGIDDDTNEIVVGIIDYMRQYDIIKRMERMGKSVSTMIAGQAEPTVIQPPQYRKRFQNAMERYFMTVPDKWIQNDI